MGLDRRTINMIKFLTKTLLGIGGGLYALIRVSGETDVLRITGALVLLAGIAYFARAAYTLFIQKGKEPLSYGKWAVVTGSTSGIGKGFVEALAAKGVNLLLISRDEQKLIAQAKTLSAVHKVECQYLVNDFKDIDNSRAFYHRLSEELKTLQGGVGMLINNVGIANEDPKWIDETSDEFTADMINVNCHSMTFMIRAVLPIMKQQKKGCILSIASASCTHPTAGLAVYSATKAFMVQLSRTLAVEQDGSGIDFQVLTPYYVVSNLYKSKKSTATAPFPNEYVASAFKHLGKARMPVYHGWWFHSLTGWLAKLYWNTGDRLKAMMIKNRERSAERAKKAT